MKRKKFGPVFIAVLAALSLYGNQILHAEEAPEMTLNVNMSTPAAVNAGEPIIVRAGLVNLRADGQITLTFPSGPWPQNVRLEVTARGGEEKKLPWHASVRNPSQSELALDPLSFSEAVWVLSPQEAAALAPGIYAVRAIIRSEDTEIKSPAVEVTIREPGGESPSPLLLALYHVHAGEGDKALALLEQHPNLLSGPGQELKGDLLYEAGRYQEAHEAFQSALALQGHISSSHLRQKKHAAWEKASEQLRRQNPDHRSSGQTGEIIEETSDQS